MFAILKRLLILLLPILYMRFIKKRLISQKKPKKTSKFEKQRKSATEGEIVE